MPNRHKNRHKRSRKNSLDNQHDTSSSTMNEDSYFADLEPPKYGWQESMALKERMLHVFTSGHFTDVVFLAGKEEIKIPAHKFILCVGSSVFAQMFHGDIAQKTKKETTRYEGKEMDAIMVPDITPEALRSVLKYLYTEEVHLEVDYVFNVLYAAKKYLLHGLEDECARFLDREINTDNVCIVLDQAILYENDHLLKACEKIIAEKTHEVVRSQAFLNIDEKTLCHILQYDSLKIDEWSLFQEVLAWAISECKRRDLELTSDNKRIVLSNALYSIRFPIMLQTEFSAYADEENCILTERECLDLLLTFTLGEKKLKSIPFNPNPRFLHENTVHRYSSDSRNNFDSYNNGYYSHSRHEIFLGEQSIGVSIQASHAARVWLVGFSIFGTSSKTGLTEITYTIKTGDRLLAQGVKTVDSLFDNSYFHRCNFEHPVSIFPGTVYVISYRSSLENFAFVNGYNGISITRFQHSRTKEQIEVKFSNINGSKTCVSSGQIPRLYFGT